MEKLKKNLDIILAASLFLLFVIYTLIVKFVGVAAVGPLGSSVGLAGINDAAHKLFGMNQTLYVLTDWLGLVAFGIMAAFVIVGAVQWIRRKSVLNVDNEILAMGIYYVLVAASYVFFEFVVINRRPVLIEGVLEASYPSSTTMLVLMVCLSAISPLKKLIKNDTLRKVINVCLVVFAVAMIVGRLVSGVHWLTDILGGIILSAALLFFYKFLLRMFNQKSEKKTS